MAVEKRGISSEVSFPLRRESILKPKTWIPGHAWNDNWRRCWIDFDLLNMLVNNFDMFFVDKSITDNGLVEFEYGLNTID